MLGTRGAALFSRIRGAGPRVLLTAWILQQYNAHGAQRKCNQHIGTSTNAWVCKFWMSEFRPACVFHMQSQQPQT